MARKNLNKDVFKRVGSSINLDLDLFGEISLRDEQSLPLKYKGINFRYALLDFIQAELMLMTAHLVFQRGFTEDEVHMIFSELAHNFMELNSEQYKIIMIATKYLKESMNAVKRKACLKNYFSQSHETVKNHQIFYMTEGKIEYQVPKLLIDRLEIYINILTRAGSIEQIETLIGQEYKLDYIESFINHSLEFKRSHESSIEEINSLYSKELEKSINELSEEEGFEYIRDVFKALKFYSIGKNSLIEADNIRLKSITHIAAKTGSGKNIICDILIRILCKNRKKVLYLTTKHADSLMLKEKYDALGLRATVIAGKGRDKYLKKYITAKAKEEENKGLSLPELVKKYENVFVNLDNSCLYWYESRQEDKSRSKGTVNHKTKVRKNCRYCEKEIKENCGLYNMYKSFKETDIFITTPANLITSSFNYDLDSSGRFLIEALFAAVDFIIIDEVDRAQKDSDSSAINNMTVFSAKTPEEEPNTFMYNLINKVYGKLGYNDYKNHNFLIKVRREIARYNQVCDILNSRFLAKEVDALIKSKLGNRTYDLSLLISKFYNSYLSSVRDINNVKLTEREFINKLLSILTNRENARKINDEYIKYIVEQHEYVHDPERLLEEEIVDDITFEAFRYVYRNFLRQELKEINLIYKKSADKSSAIKFFVFILINSALEYFLNDINKDLPLILDILEAQEELLFLDNRAKSNFHAPESLIGNIGGFSLEEYEKLENFIRKDFSVIGREILFETNKMVSSFYGIPQTPMLLLSATAIDTGSTLYTIKDSVDYLVENTNQSDEDNNINIKICVFCDGEKYAYVSGSKENERQINIKKLCKLMSKKFLNEVVKEAKSLNKGTMISVSSHNDAKYVYEAIRSIDANIKILYTSTTPEGFDPSIHIDISDVDRISQEEVDILIGISQSINRSYNIMTSDEKSSYIHNIVVLNRPIPHPNDDTTIISYINGILTKYAMKKDKLGAVDYIDCKDEMWRTLSDIKTCYGFQDMSNYLKGAIASNTLVDLKQLVGRGQRGKNNNVNLFLVDGNIIPKTAELISSGEDTKFIIDNTETSLFLAWKKILISDDIIINRLFDDLRKGFNNFKLKVYR